MNIVIEGPDGGGKSTLCELLSLHLGRVVVAGEGPSKGPGDFDKRIRRLLQYHDVIFDRHPAVSGPIYNRFREGPQDNPGLAVTRAFYAQPNFFVYCHPTSATTWVPDNAEVDTPAYNKWLAANHSGICQEYELWALQCANVVYRVGDDLDKFVKLIKGAL